LPRVEEMTNRRRRVLLDEVTIRQFLHNAYPKLVAGVAVVAGSRPVAEDSVQEALARAWERSERGEEIRNLEAWVTTVAMNLARSGLRRLRSERAMRERLGDREPTAAPETRVDVVRALSALTRRQREATVLRYYLGYDVKEIAEILGVREGTAKTTLHRARQALALRLGEETPQEANERGR
jgi:RNA polymerase sigma-70 factor (ECF subfamily)